MKARTKAFLIAGIALLNEQRDRMIRQRMESFGETYEQAEKVYNQMFPPIDPFGEEPPC